MTTASLLLAITSDKILRTCAIVAGFIVLIPMLVILTITQVGAQVVSDVLLPSGENTNPTAITTLYGTIELAKPAIWPLSGTISQEFGHYNPPFQFAHSGIDIASYREDKARAILPGTVTFAGRDFLSGNIEVHIDHGQGLSSWYAHLDKVAVVEGQTVEQGQLIGYEGDTGWATGVHLHLEVRLYQIPVNPRVLLGESNP